MILTSLRYVPAKMVNERLVPDSFDPEVLLKYMKENIDELIQYSPVDVHFTSNVLDFIERIDDPTMPECYQYKCLVSEFNSDKWLAFNVRPYLTNMFYACEKFHRAEEWQQNRHMVFEHDRQTEKKEWKMESSLEYIGEIMTNRGPHYCFIGEEGVYAATTKNKSIAKLNKNTTHEMEYSLSGQFPRLIKGPDRVTLRGINNIRIK